MKDIQRGEIYLADLGEGVGSEQKGIRPVLIVQNNRGNKYSPTVTSRIFSSIISRKQPSTTTGILCSHLCWAQDSAWEN